MTHQNNTHEQFEYLCADYCRSDRVALMEHTTGIADEKRYTRCLTSQRGQQQQAKTAGKDLLRRMGAGEPDNSGFCLGHPYRHRRVVVVHHIVPRAIGSEE